MPTASQWRVAATAAFRAGARDRNTLATALAIAVGESGLNPDARNNNPPREDSRGLWQINTLAHPTWAVQDLYDPTTNARAMWAISSSGTNWSPWTVYTSGAYRTHLEAADRAAAAMLDLAGSGGPMADAAADIPDFIVSEPRPFHAPGADVTADMIALDGASGHRLYGAAGACYNLMHANARFDGVTLRVISSFRTEADQVRIYNEKGEYHPTRNPDGAARPVSLGGDGSNHQRGKSVDLDVNDAATLQWLRTNARRYLFVNDVSTEPWHWTYSGDDMGEVRNNTLVKPTSEMVRLLDLPDRGGIFDTVTGIAGDVVAGVVGLPGRAIGGAIGAVSNPLGAIMDAVTGLWSAITDSLLNPAWWQRVGWFLLGFALLAAGARTVARTLEIDLPLPTLPGVSR